MLIPAVAAPVIACLVAACGTWLVYRITRNVLQKRREEGFRWGQIATASLVALSHGTNDAQKTMGVIALALITTGHLTGDVKEDGLPFWIIFSCALAIGLGTYIGGWRVIRTLGKGLVEIESPQGFAAEASSAAIILSSSAAGMALSTTHVATGSILGSGVGKPGAEVRWAVAGRMAVAWLVTLPAAGLVGALSFWLSHGVKSLTGSALAGDGLIFLILVGAVRSTCGGVPSSRRSTAATSTPIGTTRPTPWFPPRCARPPRPPSPRPRSDRASSEAKERSMTYLESILKVLGRGAGPRRRVCPRSSRSDWWRTRTARAATEADGTAHRAQSGAEVPRASRCSCSSRWVIVTAVFWITRATIIHHFGVDLFPFIPKK